MIIAGKNKRIFWQFSPTFAAPVSRCNPARPTALKIPAIHV
jgi:hypothetical protein